MKRLGIFLATAAGAGYSPFAPGTAGSAVGIVVYLLTRHWSLGLQGVLLGVITLVGIWAADVAERHFGREDPGQVVIDEVAGQLVTLFATGVGVPGAALGFLVFRALDVVKPFPANRFEAFPGGLGIMADDLMAGVYGLIIIRIAVAFIPWVR